MRQRGEAGSGNYGRAGVICNGKVLWTQAVGAQIEQSRRAWRRGVQGARSQGDSVPPALWVSIKK